MLSRFELWDSFTSSNKAPRDKYTREREGTWEDVIHYEVFARPAAISISWNRSWQIQYVFDSLGEAIRLFFIQNLVSSEPIRGCKECGSAFIS
jgi:hypothetical protein